MKLHAPKTAVVATCIVLCVIATQFIQCKTTKADTRNNVDMSGDPNDFNDAIEKNMKEMFDKGKAVFRSETFGDEVFWTVINSSFKKLLLNYNDSQRQVMWQICRHDKILLSNAPMNLLVPVLRKFYRVNDSIENHHLCSQRFQIFNKIILFSFRQIQFFADKPYFFTKY